VIFGKHIEQISV